MKFGKSKGPSIEMGYQKRPSAFDLQRFGIKPDDNKDYRWAAPDRVDEHKYLNGYSVHMAKSGEKGNEANAIETKGKMILMERSKDIAEESKARKVLRTEAQTRSARQIDRNYIERISSKYGVDVHKIVENLEKKIDEDGG